MNKEEIIISVTSSNPADTIIGISSIDIALVSALVSIFALFVASYLAWKTKLSPPKLVGSFSYVIVWSFDGGDKKNIGDEYIIPHLWLANIGARPFLVGDIRLTIFPNSSNKFHLSPIHSVPLSAIEKPNIFSDFEIIRLGEAPFNGFCISNTEQWKNVNAFPISSKERAVLKGNIKIVFEVRKLGTNKYKPILTENINFESEGELFDWKRWAGEGGPNAAYYYKSK